MAVCVSLLESAGNAQDLTWCGIVLNTCIYYRYCCACNYHTVRECTAVMMCTCVGFSSVNVNVLLYNKTVGSPST